MTKEYFIFVNSYYKYQTSGTDTSTNFYYHIGEILPTDFKMTGTEVYVKKIGNAIILISKDNPWQTLIDSLDQFDLIRLQR